MFPVATRFSSDFLLFGHVATTTTTDNRASRECVSVWLANHRLAYTVVVCSCSDGKPAGLPSNRPTATPTVSPSWIPLPLLCVPRPKTRVGVSTLVHRAPLIERTNRVCVAVSVCNGTAPSPENEKSWTATKKI